MVSLSNHTPRTPATSVIPASAAGTQRQPTKPAYKSHPVRPTIPAPASHSSPKAARASSATHPSKSGGATH